jgi:DivIVA domain-containing protein
VTLLLVVVAIAIVAGVAVLVARGEPVLAEDPVEARALSWPPESGVDAEGLASARFTVALRGYRMDEVDRVLDDARAALLAREARIADLERTVRFLAPAGVPAPEPSADPSGQAGRAVSGVVPAPAPSDPHRTSTSDTQP